MSTSHREMPCRRRFLEVVLGKVVPVPQLQPRAFSAQAVEALEANAVSDVGLETEYTRWPCRPVVEQRKAKKPPSSRDHKAELGELAQKLLCVQWRQMGHWKDGHQCLAKVRGSIGREVPAS